MNEHKRTFHILYIIFIYFIAFEGLMIMYLYQKCHKQSYLCNIIICNIQQPLLQFSVSHDFFRSHSNMLICLSSNISYYYQW